MTNYWNTFVELIAMPFEHVPLIWGIVPLYFALLLNESTSEKANFQTALQTGFSFLWASAQWIYPYFKPRASMTEHVAWDAMTPINLFVTLVVLVLGVLALVSGIRKKYPKYFGFLGRTRFSNYFMITIYGMQSHYPGFNWTWDRLIAIVLFAAPVWLVLHYGLKPLRNR
jgi:hypothetical protein